MLLSRVFSLLLGTTLFVMIWTMQDGNHNTPHTRYISDLRALVPAHASRSEVTEFFPAQPPTTAAAAAAQTPSESTLWIFADEPPAQIAVK